MLARVLRHADAASLRAAAATCREWRAAALLDAAWAGRAARAFGDAAAACALAGVDARRTGRREAFRQLACHPCRDLLLAAAAGRRQARSDAGASWLVTLSARHAACGAPEDDSSSEEDAPDGLEALNECATLSADLAPAVHTWEGLCVPLPSPHAQAFEADQVQRRERAHQLARLPAAQRWRNALDGGGGGGDDGDGDALPPPPGADRPCHYCWAAIRRIREGVEGGAVGNAAGRRRISRVLAACSACAARAEVCCQRRARTVVASTGADSTQRTFVFHSPGAPAWRLGFLAAIPRCGAMQAAGLMRQQVGSPPEYTGKLCNAAGDEAQYTAFLVFTRVRYATGEMEQLPLALGGLRQCIRQGGGGARPPDAIATIEHRFPGRAATILDFFGMRMGRPLQFLAFVSLHVTARGPGCARPLTVLRCEAQPLTHESVGPGVGRSKLCASNFSVRVLDVSTAQQTAPSEQRREPPLLTLGIRCGSSCRWDRRRR